jgi:hypothetical protein
MACSHISEMLPPYVTQDYTLEPIVTPISLSPSTQLPRFHLRNLFCKTSYVFFPRLVITSSVV